MSSGARWSISSARLETQLQDRKPIYSTWEATAEAGRCLYCHDAPCIPACPTTIDIPTFIHKIATGNLRGSARTILKSNLLGLSCARVCPVEVLCEGACVYVGWQRPPITIGRLQRYAMEHGGARGLLPKAKRSGRTVGLVGAGPASLACAGTLARFGHTAVIYERDDLPGGLNTTGIAPYKLQADDALEEIRFIKSLGVEFQTGVELGKDVSVDELLERHDALFLGPGLGPDSCLGVPGEEGPGVYGAIEWIRRLKLTPTFSVEGIDRAFVVGGGNTAVDVARELAGLGVGRVTLLYRRPAEKMKAYAHELAQARQEGVVVVTETAVAEVFRDAGTLAGIRLVESENGRPTDRDFGIEKADLMVVAIGQTKLRELVEMFPSVECDESGCIAIDPDTGATGNPRIFAGGDAVNGGKEVVNAVHDGQVAARSMDDLLREAPAGRREDG